MMSALLKNKAAFRQIRLHSSHVLKSDINITRNGEVKLATGHNGRSSRSGYTATVFGSTGFLGRYLTSRLAKSGTLTVAPYRDEYKGRLLKVAGDLGVVNVIEFDMRNLETINEAVKYSDIVYNLIGADYNTKNFSMADVNIEGTSRIAQAVADHNVPRFVHVSSYNANRDSDSVFYATKAIGEEVAKEIYPDVSIVRPAPMYGDEDKFLNKFASKFRLVTANHMQETMLPVHVLDVVAALEKIGFDDSTVGETFELNGPERLSVAEIRQLIAPVTKRQYNNTNIPKKFFQDYAKFLQKFWWPMINPDQVERQFIDQVVSKNVKTFADLGIEPAKLQDLVYKYTRKYRSQSHAQDLPPDVKDLRTMKPMFKIGQ